MVNAAGSWRLVANCQLPVAVKLINNATVQGKKLPEQRQRTYSFSPGKPDPIEYHLINNQ